MKFVNWLKFYFGGFFLNGLSKEAETRGWGNAILSVVMAFALFVCSLFGGNMAAYGSHYKRATSYRAFIASVFGENGLSVKFENGTGVCKVGDGEYSADLVINTFKNESDKKYATNGCNLIVDMRPLDTTYDDFIIVWTNKNDKTTKTDDEYNGLTDEEKKDYTFSVTYTGNTLDIAGRESDYKTLLDGLEEGDVAKDYKKLNDKKDELSSDDYLSQLYILYLTARYPELKGVDSYSYAPTLKTYYQQLTLEKEGNKLVHRNYLMLFCNFAVVSFTTDKGVAVDADGTYKKLNGSEVTSANADTLVPRSLTSAADMVFTVYFFNISQFAFGLIATVLVLIIFSYIASAKLKLNFGTKLGGAAKIVLSYLTITAVISGIAAFILSFMLGRSATFLVAIIINCVVLALRVLILYVIEIIKNRKNPPVEEAEGVEDTQIYEE